MLDSAIGLVKDGWPPFLLPFFPPLYDFLLPTTPSCPCRFVVETSHRTCWLPLVLAPFLLHYKKHPQEKAWRLFFPCWIFVLRPTVVQTRTTFLELQRPPPRVSRRARSTQAYSFTAAETISTGSILFTHTHKGIQKQQHRRKDDFCNNKQKGRLILLPPESRLRSSSHTIRCCSH